MTRTKAATAKRGATFEDAPLAPIEARYLVLTLVPCYVDSSGSLWLDRLWHRDVVAHFRYLKRMILAAPAVPKGATDEEPPDLVRLGVPGDVDFSFVALPYPRSTREAIAALPELVGATWRAVSRADVVHSGVAGWPIPVGWIANPIALARGRMLVVLVESAPWRTSGAPHERARDHVRALVMEALARFYVARADVKVFTHERYMRTLAPDGAPECHVTPAAWIEEQDIVSWPQALASWAQKRRSPVRLLFAARLVPHKGTDVLLDALRELDARSVRAHLDVVGDGPRRRACVDAARELRTVAMRVLDPVPYGPRFFELVRAYHAVVVPNLGDEQPRIVFDAYAQAVPVIAFDTDGIRPHVQDGVTGRLIARDDLAGAVERATQSAARLERMGLAALAHAPQFTHRAMHEQRWRILDRALRRNAERA